MNRAVVAENGRAPLRALPCKKVSLTLFKEGEVVGHWKIKEDSSWVEFDDSDE